MVSKATNKLQETTSDQKMVEMTTGGHLYYLLDPLEGDGAAAAKSGHPSKVSGHPSKDSGRSNSTSGRSHSDSNHLRANSGNPVSSVTLPSGRVARDNQNKQIGSKDS